MHWYFSRGEGQSGKSWRRSSVHPPTSGSWDSNTSQTGFSRTSRSTCRLRMAWQTCASSTPFSKARGRGVSCRSSQATDRVISARGLLNDTHTFESFLPPIAQHVGSQAACGVDATRVLDIDGRHDDVLAKDRRLFNDVAIGIDNATLPM